MTRHSLVPLLAQLADAGTVFVAAILAFYLRFDAAVPVVPQQYHAYLFCILVGVLLNAFLATALGAYRNWRGAGLGDVLTPLLLAWGATALTLVVLLFALKTSEAFSRLWFGSWVLLAAVLLALERLVLLRVLRYLRARGVNRKRVVLVGFSEQIPELLQRLKKADWAGYEVVALFLPQGKDAAAVSGVPVRRDLAALDSFVREHEVTEVWLTCPLREEAFLQEVLWLLRHSTVNIRYLPDLFALRLINHGVSEVMGFPMLDLSASPMTGVNRLVKAVEDRVLAAIILLLISPLMLALALGVKLSSPGPVFYRQERVGWNGKPFMMLKFRSMPVDVEKNGVCWGNAQAKPVTPFGAFLRRTSLDELPQFINVLKGEMSIVGPRPERPMFVEQFKDEIPGYMKKHMVKAGITGWAQVNGWRGDTDLKKRIEYDLYYIEHWSLWFDLKIIFLTVFKGLVHPNAY
jgi:putative colanic acid biosynthesis UDP-glucose lipid carrier transferase